MGRLILLHCAALLAFSLSPSAICQAAPTPSATGGSGGPPNAPPPAASTFLRGLTQASPAPAPAPTRGAAAAGASSSTNPASNRPIDPTQDQASLVPAGPAQNGGFDGVISNQLPDTTVTPHIFFDLIFWRTKLYLHIVSCVLLHSRRVRTCAAAIHMISVPCDM
jgi:hypothetical protein